MAQNPITPQQMGQNPMNQGQMGQGPINQGQMGQGPISQGQMMPGQMGQGGMMGMYKNPMMGQRGNQIGMGGHYYDPRYSGYQHQQWFLELHFSINQYYILQCWYFISYTILVVNLMFM